MRVKIEDKKNCQKLIKIEVEQQKVKTVLEDVYKAIGKDAQVPGFRKGKAPRDMLELHYNATAKDEALRHLVWDAYRDTIKTNNIEPLSYPIIEDVKFNHDSPLTFTIKIDVRPAVDLKSYTNIKVNRLPDAVSDEEINKALEAVRDTAARFEPVEGRPIKTGDYAVCDYDCSVDAKSIDNQKGVWLHINEEPSLQDVKKAIIGCKKGDIKEVGLTLPKNYKITEQAGKKALYKITINEIKQKVLPTLDDALAKQVGEFENLQKLKTRIEEEISYSKKQQQRADMENQIFEHLLKIHQFEVPQSTVERQLQIMVDDAKMRLAYQGYKKEDIEAQENNLKESLAINAQKQVKIFFILEEIAQRENVNVTDEELKRHIEKIADNAKQDKEKFKQAMEGKGLIDNIKEQLLHEKVVDFLLEKAKISEHILDT